MSLALSNFVVTKPKRMSKKEIFVRLFAVMFISLAIVSAAVPIHTTHAAPALACVDGADDVTGDPCLDIQVDSLMTEIFKWANVIIPILLPLIAIGIGLNFGSSILGGIKNVFNGIKIG